MVRLTRRLLLPILSILFVTLGAAHIRAQDEVPGVNDTARKIDEFELIDGDSHGAHLDNFAIELGKSPNSVGYVICYGPEGEGSGTGACRCKITEDYLTNVRDILPSRIKTVYGGRYKELKASATELWVVPEEAEPPKPQKYENETATFSGKFLEYDSSEFVSFIDSDGPSIGDVTSAALADILRQQTSARVYIVGYNAAGAAPGAWRRSAKAVAATLQGDYKVNAEQIVILCGGYNAHNENGTSRIAIWVAPASAPAPVEEEKAPEPVPDKAVQISSYEQYSLGNATTVRQIFEGFADVLRNNERLSACIIIRPEKKVEERGEETSADTEPDVDMVSLADGWKTELEKYGISRNRLIVIVAPVEESDRIGFGSLETWIVPPGAQLPSPNAVEEERVETEEVSTNAEDNPQR